MTPRLSLFALPPLRVPAVAASSPATFRSSSAYEFSDHFSAAFAADAYPDGAGNSSNLPASISYRPNKTPRSATPRDAKRIARSRSKSNTFVARFTRNGYSLPQVNLRQTSAAMFAPYFINPSYLLRP